MNSIIPSSEQARKHSRRLRVQVLNLSGFQIDLLSEDPTGNTRTPSLRRIAHTRLVKHLLERKSSVVVLESNSIVSRLHLAVSEVLAEKSESAIASSHISLLITHTR